MTLNFQNGTLKLPSIELQPHDPADRIMTVLPYDYDPKATCSNFDRVLEEVLDPDAADFLMRILGHALKGTGELQKLCILVGAGPNGKTTVVEAVANAMGPYAVSAEPSLFMRSQFKGAINNDIARLSGARLIRTSELNIGQVLDSSLVKRMTGGDQITARFLHQEHFEFTVRGLLCMVSNFMPVFDGSDPAIGRRLLVTRFNRVIEKSKIDFGLPEKLKLEVAGIMNRLLQGLARYELERSWIPECVRKETDAAIDDGNQVGQFFRDRCKITVGSRMSARALYDQYRVWCVEEGSGNPMSNIAFKGSLSRTTKIDPARDSKGNYWPDVALNS